MNWRFVLNVAALAALVLGVCASFERTQNVANSQDCENGVCKPATIASAFVERIKARKKPVLKTVAASEKLVAGTVKKTAGVSKKVIKGTAKRIRMFNKCRPKLFRRCR